MLRTFLVVFAKWFAITAAVMTFMLLVSLMLYIAYAQPILPEKVTVTEVELVAEEGTVTLGTPAKLRITVYLAEPAAQSIELEVLVKCTHVNNTVTKYARVLVEQGQLSGTGVVEVAFPETGTWTCRAYCMSVVSDPVVIKVVSPEAAFLARVAELLILFAVIAVIVITVALLYVRRRAVIYIR